MFENTIACLLSCAHIFIHCLITENGSPEINFAARRKERLIRGEDRKQWEELCLYRYLEMACGNVKFVNAFPQRIRVVFVQVDKSCEYLNNYAVEWNYYVAHSEYSLFVKWELLGRYYCNSCFTHPS